MIYCAIIAFFLCFVFIFYIFRHSWEVLPKLPASLLKVRLLTYCYSEVYDKELAQEAHAIINTWDQSQLTLEQVEIIEELGRFEENEYSWEVVE